MGQHEPNHTAQQQLFPILADDRHNPTLADLENAFDIETVTREFFGRYKELFVQVRDELDAIAARDGRVSAEFEARGIDSGTFAKKLLGQIVFLYFLQKKGWLGVPPGQPWGRWRRYYNFFEELLEPLFYEALAVERPDNLYPPQQQVHARRLWRAAAPAAGRPDRGGDRDRLRRPARLRRHHLPDCVSAAQTPASRRADDADAGRGGYCGGAAVGGGSHGTRMEAATGESGS